MFKKVLIALTLFVSFTPSQHLLYASHPEISGAEFVRSLVETGEVAQLRAMIFEKLDQATDGSEFANQIVTRLKTEFDNILATADYEKLNHWPVLKVREIGILQRLAFAFSDLLPPPTHSPVTPIVGNLEDLLSDCDTEYPLPAPVSRFPKLRNGHFPDTSIEPCEFTGSNKFAEILTALAENGVNPGTAAIRYNSKDFTSPAALIAELQSTGHTIRLQNERVFANFLSYIINDSANLRMPLWIDTEIPFSNPTNVETQTLSVPMGHSQYVWIISGPVVRARVSFYLGTSGVGFNPRNDERPTWTGSRIDHIITDSAQIVHSIELAEAYYQRIKQEYISLVPNLRADGYGLFGVCNDSTAVIESVLRGSSTGYPLVRPSFIDRASPVHDVLSSYLQTLPKDPEISRASLRDPSQNNLIFKSSASNVAAFY